MDHDKSTLVPFWQAKTLAEMSKQEWESLCDGCAQCCQLKFQAAEDHKFVVMPVVCKLLDLDTRRCESYENRHTLVPDCVHISPDNIESLYWLPETCAYKLVAEGKPLYDWHPLIAGDFQKMEELGISVASRVLSERDIHPEDLAVQVMKWVDNRDD